MQLEWRTCQRTSAWHWAWVASRGLPTRADVPSELISASEQVADMARRMQVPPSRLWQLLVELAPLVSRPAELVDRIMVRLLPPAARTTTRWEQLDEIVRRIESAFERAIPRFDAEIGLRGGPLRSQWEEHGPGLMHAIAKLMGPHLLVDQAEVVLVQPLAGGFGWAHMNTNRVHVEAVLTHPSSDLPETLRLAWLLSQLDLDRPVYSDAVHRDHQSWWETFRHMRPTVATGLVALDRLLHPDA